MRLTPDQLTVIRQTVAATLGEGAEVWLFGSRLDEAASGGDIDLYVELDGTPAETLASELSLYAGLQRRLGAQRIDLVVHRRGQPLRDIDREVRRLGVRL